LRPEQRILISRPDGDVVCEQSGAEGALLCNERVAGSARDAQRRSCEQARFPDLRTDMMPRPTRRAAPTTLSERSKPPIFETCTLIIQRAVDQAVPQAA